MVQSFSSFSNYQFFIALYLGLWVLNLIIELNREIVSSIWEKNRYCREIIILQI